LRPLIDPVEGPATGAALRRVADTFVASFERPWGERFVDFLADKVPARKSPVRDAAE